MRTVKQPPDSYCCGQACCATLLGITLKQACALVGSGATVTKDLKFILDVYGVKHGDRRVRGHPTKDETAFLLVRADDCSWAHWVVWKNGKYYDPGVGASKKETWEDAKVVSHLKIYE